MSRCSHLKSNTFIAFAHGQFCFGEMRSSDWLATSFAVLLSVVLICAFSGRCYSGGNAGHGLQLEEKTKFAQRRNTLVCVLLRSLSILVGVVLSLDCGWFRSLVCVAPSLDPPMF